MQREERRSLPTEKELEQIWQAYKGEGEKQYSKYLLYSAAIEQGIDLDSLRDRLLTEWLMNNMPQEAATDGERGA